ncbi:MAG: pilus assembly protein PilM [Candidatus Omnitrophica bacterium]|nr:pilus assembly protein PilM [Candidatus Omnitrophota bacterium]
MAFFRTTVGLYIGPKTVQIAQMKSIAGKIQLTNFVHIDIFDGEQSDSADKEALILSALKKAVNKSKIDLKRVNTVLMPGMVLLRYFQMPRISAEELEEAVRFEARKYIPFRLEEAVTGFYILKEDQEKKKLGILSLVTKEESIKNHLTILHKVDIQPTAVETASFALLRLLEHSGDIEKDKSNAVLYLYAQRINIIILRNSIPYFVRDISLAKKEEWIDDETAEFLLGGKISSADNRVTTLENMISELKISFEYYKKELGKERVSKIILCGEVDDFDDLEVVSKAAQDQPDNPCPLSVFLEKQFNISVKTVDPLKNIISPKAKPLPYTFPMLAVTIGAALRNLTKSTVEIDLFRARKKTSLKAKVLTIKMIVFGLGALLACFVIMFLVSSFFISKENNLLDQEKRSAPKFMDLSSFSEDQLKTGELEIKKRIGAYDKIVTDRFIVTDKMGALTKIISPGIWINKLYFGLSTKDRNYLDRSLELSLKGFVYSEQKGMEIEIVNDFTEALKVEDLFFSDFKVIKTGSVSREAYFGIPVMSFEMTCFSKAGEN